MEDLIRLLCIVFAVLVLVAFRLRGEQRGDDHDLKEVEEQARLQAEQEQEQQAEQARLTAERDKREEREREEKKRREEQARAEERMRINLVRKAEKAALAFAIATKDSELENAGEIAVMFSGCGTPITLGKHAKVSRETIDRIDGDREAAELCYIAHGFVCVAEQGEGHRTRLFSATGDDVITADALAFWGEYPKAFPMLDTFFYNKYKADPTIDIVKERRIAVGELPPGDYPVFECRAGEGAECGYIYVASNVESFGEGVVKIGMTTRDPVERIRELNSTSVPTDFSYNLILATPNARKAERIIHNALHNRRVNKEKKKEFFRISPKELEEVLSSLAGKPIRMKRKNAV